MTASTAFDQLCINTIRTLAMDGVQKANSGHPGFPMGAAPMAYVLWSRFLKHHPQKPAWMDRDRFVLSAGHGSMLLYSLLHLTGYDLPIEELHNFRQWGSLTPGHPEHGLTSGVETTTGPLGQGFANGVGMAMAEAYLAATYNRPGFEIIDHCTYGIVSDGDLMEGIASEAASLAGHLKLGKLIYLYDDNHISIDGDTSLAFTEDRAARFRAYGWHVESVADGNDLEAIAAAIEKAKNERAQPSLICVRTIIGFGSPNKQGTAASHGEPLGAEEVKLSKENLQWGQHPAFYVPEAVRQLATSATQVGESKQTTWQKRFDAYQKEHPELAAQLLRTLKNELPANWDAEIPVFPPDQNGIATRVASGKVINAIAARLPELIGGSADLTGSIKSKIESSGGFQNRAYGNRNLYFGVREHGMAGAANGMVLHGGIRPYVGTFLIFSDYMRPSMRLAAMMEQPVTYLLTHDSIGLGEDGPTHQPIEHFAALRAIPNLVLLRPCDANETAEAWRFAMQHKTGPVALALSRQNLPILDRSKMAPASGLQYGGYVLLDARSGMPEIILIATGSEVWPSLQAAEILQKEGVKVRVVSMPSQEIFDAQAASYRESVLPANVQARLAVEAGISQGWHKYIGARGDTVTIDGRFGASAPWQVLMVKFGFTSENIAAKARQLL